MYIYHDLESSFAIYQLAAFSQEKYSNFSTNVFTRSSGENIFFYSEHF